MARVGVAVSDTVDGDYQYVKSFRPLGQESRDIVVVGSNLRQDNALR